MNGCELSLREPRLPTALKRQECAQLFEARWGTPWLMNELMQDLLGHVDVATTQIDTLVMARPGLWVRSPWDL